MGKTKLNAEILFDYKIGILIIYVMYDIRGVSKQFMVIIVIVIIIIVSKSMAKALYYLGSWDMFILFSILHKFALT